MSIGSGTGGSSSSPPARNHHVHLGHHGHHGSGSSGTGSKLNRMLMTIFIVAAFMTMLSIFGPTMYLVEQQLQHDLLSSSSMSTINSGNKNAAMSMMQMMAAGGSSGRGSGGFNSIRLAPAGIHSQQEQQQQQQQEENKVSDGAIKQENVVDTQSILVEVTDLEHEELFRKTIRSCLPSDDEKKCKVHIPELRKTTSDDNNNDKKSKEDEDEDEDEDNKVQRVAIISPPSEVVNTVIRWSEQIMENHNHRELATRKEPYDIELIPRSHVPPYGYGKTHGLSKIIRLVPQPLLLEVIDALVGVFTPEEEEEHGANVIHIITLQDLKMALRQILRFHCRLSHVAAHTAILSINTMDTINDKKRITYKQLQDFLAPRATLEHGDEDEDDDNGNNNNKDGDDEGDDDDAHGGEEEEEEEQEEEDEFDGGLFDAREKIATRILSHIQQQQQQQESENQNNNNNNKQNIMKTLDQVLVDELKATNDLTVWPCPSFYAVGDDPHHPTANVSAIVQRIAQALAPDCHDDPYSNCWVEKDKCESNGDGICVKSNK